MRITGLPKRAYVYSVHWKHRERFPDETFITTRSISEKYPAYSETSLDRIFKTTHNKFEDENVLIKKVPITYEPDTSAPIPVISKVRFWDSDYNKIDWIESYRSIIERIIERGSKQEWKQLVNYYGLSRVSNTIRNEILYLTDDVIEDVCEYFSFEKEELLCYIRKQSMPKHWY
ncbi:MAG TPA: hypothetical protein VK787_16745 [Puia sp.]|jgi:hypothetical protein|nr:hypothetical protein [Puia sp.]